MSLEKRKYARIPVDERCVIYAGIEEFEGNIVNISENGVGIKVNKPINCSKLTFLFVDRKAENFSKRNMYSCKARVVRRAEDFVGCTFARTFEISEFINRRRAEDFFKNKGACSC
ncbi:MAG TPA: PilZ domain-containing protein [Lachnospiraceae bacterium]|jgi:hypothetical protein|nr:PilZ domain-containing protein [Lachnospiraceae bacterium]